MPQILFHEQLTSREDVLQHLPLIRRILSGTKANICKLIDIDYLGHSVFRVYSNNNIKNERRLIYSYVTYQEREIFMVLTVMEDHDYDKLKRKLCNIKSEEHQVLLEIEAEPDEIPESSAHELLEPLELLPAASSQGQTKIFDENEEGGSLLLTPLIVEGPPGTGKSRRIHTLMIRYLSDNQNLDVLNSSNPLSNPPQILLLTPTLELTEKHQELFQRAMPENQGTVIFSTWNQLLKSYYPEDYHLIKENEFADWLLEKDCSEPAKIVHSELSLIIALGVKKYRELGKRECHYPHNDAKLKWLLELLTKWKNNLAEKKIN